ncbi:hypothetical protein E2C01_074675 [Portunus trituberculatus]|uniref:Uncharacterized protein n=1 Tax=Portunus trituberculatus TaxID=210409 RepID=A0A5B7IGW5_PORTR|nr:hypothetical protein [Portunus trituberculatus]
MDSHEEDGEIREEGRRHHHHHDPEQDDDDFRHVMGNVPEKPSCALASIPGSPFHSSSTQLI